MRYILSIILLISCNPKTIYLCDNSIEGCKIVSIEDDIYSCQFKALSLSGKDNVKGNFKCVQK